MVVGPRAAERTVASGSPALGDVVLLDRQLCSKRARFCSACASPPRPLARDDEHGRAVDPFDRLLHLLGGQHAAVVVLQDRGGAAPERRDGAAPTTMPTSEQRHRPAAPAPGGACARRVMVRAPSSRRPSRRGPAPGAAPPPDVALLVDGAMGRSKPSASFTIRRWSGPASAATRRPRAPDHDVPDAMRPREVEQRVHRVVGLEPHHLGAELSRFSMLASRWR